MTSEYEDLFSFMQQAGICRYLSTLPEFAKPLIPVTKRTTPDNNLYLLHGEGARAYTRQEYLDTIEDHAKRGKLYLSQQTPKIRRARRLIVLSLGGRRHIVLAPWYRRHKPEWMR